VTHSEAMARRFARVWRLERGRLEQATLAR